MESMDGKLSNSASMKSMQELEKSRRSRALSTEFISMEVIFEAAAVYKMFWECRRGGC